MPYKVALTFEAVNEILKRDHSNEKNSKSFDTELRNWNVKKKVSARGTMGRGKTRKTRKTPLSSFPCPSSRPSSHHPSLQPPSGTKRPLRRREVRLPGIIFIFRFCNSFLQSMITWSNASWLKVSGSCIMTALWTVQINSSKQVRLSMIRNNNQELYLAKCLMPRTNSGTPK